MLKFKIFVYPAVAVAELVPVDPWSRELGVWDDLSNSDNPSPQDLEALLAAYLPKATSSNTV
jgi:hypothetical protein